MKRKASVRRKIGNVVSVPLGNGRFGFGWVLKEPLVAFFDFSSDNPAPPVAEVIRKPVAFRICVMKVALTSTWPVIGHADIPVELQEEPWFFMQDDISGALSITRDGDERVPADLEQCESLECAAAWSACHVEQRLRDHFAGVPNSSVEFFRPIEPALAAHGGKARRIRESLRR